MQRQSYSFHCLSMHYASVHCGTTSAVARLRSPPSTVLIHTVKGARMRVVASWKLRGGAAASYATHVAPSRGLAPSGSSPTIAAASRASETSRPPAAPDGPTPTRAPAIRDEFTTGSRNRLWLDIDMRQGRTVVGSLDSYSRCLVSAMRIASGRAVLDP